MNMLTTPYVFDPDQATAMAQAGADILIPHMGLTTKGTIGAQTALTLEESARRCQAMHDAAKRVNKDVLVLCHGGPIAEPQDAQYILDHTEGIVRDHRPRPRVHRAPLPLAAAATRRNAVSDPNNAPSPPHPSAAMCTQAR
jgi:predicted TIM-barrel enzyme